MSARTTVPGYAVRERFRLSTRLDDDLRQPAGRRPGALDGYVVTESALALLRRMADLVASGQRAFTWTGAYGSGKSSLALLLCALLSPDAAVRRRARSILEAAQAGDVADRLRAGMKGWAVARVVARPGVDLESEVRRALLAAACERLDWHAARDLVGELPVAEAVSRLARRCAGASGGGLLIAVDELGRAFEGEATGRANLHFMQDLAEAANRSEAGPAVVVGILHQAFLEYAGSRSRAARDEWSKVQGRFVDLPVSVAATEVLDLVGDAIVGPPPPTAGLTLAAAVAEEVSGTAGEGHQALALRLSRCWPLHPVTALLLGPVSRRRFGQNERSVFSFLCSGEPAGFARFAADARTTAAGPYGPDRLWDYLSANLEPAILASPDGHRWAEAADAVERAARRGGALHVALAKVIGLVDLFGRNAGLKATAGLLALCGAEGDAGRTVAALRDLKEWSVAVHRAHLGSWAVFAGSDVDVDALVTQARDLVDPADALRQVLGEFDAPVVAKRHYVQNGTMRWFMLRLVPASDLPKALERPRTGDATVVLAFPENADAEADAAGACRELSSRPEASLAVLGWSSRCSGARDAAVELAACARLRSDVEAFRGDSVARRELEAHEALARQRLDAYVRAATASAEWFVGGRALEEEGCRPGVLSEVASWLADRWYDRAPPIRNELLNRERPSSNAVAARRALMYRMVLQPDVEGLGIEGTPPEMAAYLGLLKANGLHRLDPAEGHWAFSRPGDAAPSFATLWDAFVAFLASAEASPRPVADLYRAWAERPLGLRAGVAPVLALAFLLAEEDGLAFYEGDEFRSRLDDYLVDRLLQDPAALSVRRFETGRVGRATLGRLGRLATSFTRQELPQATPLSVAKPLVEFVRALPSWVRRTRGLDATATAVRDAVATTRDPVALLFQQLPSACGVGPLAEADDGAAEAYVQRLTGALTVLETAYAEMLGGLRSVLVAGLGEGGRDEAAIEAVARRGRAVGGRTGDFRLDAFAQRVGTATPSGLGWVEQVASLAVNKPSREWTDADLERARVEISDLAGRFRRIERLLDRRGASGTTVVLNLADMEGVVERAAFFPAAEGGSDEVRRATAVVLEGLRASGAGRHVWALAMAEALREILSGEEGAADGADAGACPVATTARGPGTRTVQ